MSIWPFFYSNPVAFFYGRYVLEGNVHLMDESAELNRTELAVSDKNTQISNIEIISVILQFIQKNEHIGRYHSYFHIQYKLTNAP